MGDLKDSLDEIKSKLEQKEKSENRKKSEEIRLKREKEIEAERHLQEIMDRYDWILEPLTDFMEVAFSEDKFRIEKEMRLDERLVGFRWVIGHDDIYQPDAWDRPKHVFAWVVFVKIKYDRKKEKVVDKYLSKRGLSDARYSSNDKKYRFDLNQSSFSDALKALYRDMLLKDKQERRKAFF